jgi:glycopeptide antibiotics resistance protein
MCLISRPLITEKFNYKQNTFKPHDYSSFCFIVYIVALVTLIWVLQSKTMKDWLKAKTVFTIIVPFRDEDANLLYY